MKQLLTKPIEDKSIRELKPILQVARIFGLGPYSINNTNLCFSKSGLIYSAIFFTVFTYLLIDRLYIFVRREWNEKLQSLYLLVTIISGLTVCTEFVTFILAQQKIQACLNSIRYHDMSVKYGYQTKNEFANWSWRIVMASFLFSLPIVGLTYLLDVKPMLGAIGAFLYCSFMTLGILKFLAFAMIIFIRFRALNLKLIADLFSVVDMEQNYRSLNCQEVWQRHEYLTAAAKQLNSIYTIQLSIWFLCLFLSSLLHIHEIVEGNHEFYHMIRGILFTSFCALLLTALIVVCHLTANEANRMGEILSSPKFFRQCNSSERQNIVFIGQYFQFNSFHFSASGFFNINLSVLLTVASAMTTFLVILIH